MIGADEALHAAGVVRADARSAVSAGVVEGADRPVALAHDDDGEVADPHREVISRLRNFAIVADEQPFPVEDRLEVEAVEVGVGIEALLQAQTFSPRLQRRQHRVFRVHVSIPRDHCCDQWILGDVRAAKPTAGRTVAKPSPPDRPPRSIRLVERLVSGLESCPKKGPERGAFPDLDDPVALKPRPTFLPLRGQRRI